MNQFIDTRIKRISAQIGELERVLKSNEEDLAIEREEKKELRDGQWRARQESATLKRIDVENDELADENAKFKEERKTLKEGIAKILAYVKLVDGGLRP